MLAVTVPSVSEPSCYVLSEVSPPSLVDPTDVIINVHAASVNPLDVKKANGALKFAVKVSFPYRIGYDCSGTVTQIACGVQNLKVGDEIYVQLPEVARGSSAEFVTCPECFVAIKPFSISFAEAASMPLADMTALQALRKYDGSSVGKTVFVPAGVVDHIKSDPGAVIPTGCVDFVLDTTGSAMHFLRLMKPRTGVIISIATLPSGDLLQVSDIMRRLHSPRLPFLVRFGLNTLDAISKVRAWRWKIHYEYMLLEPSGKDLETLAGYVDQRMLKPVVGTTVNLRDIERVRAACQVVFSGKGSIGKTVIQVIEG